MTADRPQLPMRDFFAGVAEYAFQTRIGIADPPLIDYITDLLTRFIRSDTLYKVRNLEGRRLGEVGQMLAEAEARVGDARREVHRHIGDFALFWTGVYPEAVERLRRRHCKDAIVSYTVQGKRGYLITSRLEEEQRHDEEADLFRRLSEQFELCAVGLRKVREEWEQADPPPGGLLK